MGPKNREVGETIYIDALPYPVKATIVKVCPVAWGLHTVRREDMEVNTTANEQSIVREEYAQYMWKLHNEAMERKQRQ